MFKFQLRLVVLIFLYFSGFKYFYFAFFQKIDTYVGKFTNRDEYFKIGRDDDVDIMIKTYTYTRKKKERPLEIIFL